MLELIDTIFNHHVFTSLERHGMFTLQWVHAVVGFVIDHGVFECRLFVPSTKYPIEPYYPIFVLDALHIYVEPSSKRLLLVARTAILDQLENGVIISERMWQVIL